MPDFTVRADHIDVEQIMQQIRTRIRDKRGVDYTEAEVRELASVKLDRFLDPRAVRSDLLAHFRRQHQPTPLLGTEEWPALYQFDAELAYGSSRGALGQVLRLIRRVLNPILKLFINPGPILHVLHLQGSINEKHRDALERVSRRLQTRDELDALNFEMFNNLVVEATRLGIEVKNLRMQVESLSTRLDFDERRGRALEGVVQYRPGAPVAPPPPVDDSDEEAGEPGSEGRSARRRRRRRGRRRGTGEAAAGGPEDQSSEPSSDQPGDRSNERADADAERAATSSNPPAASSGGESFQPSLETGPGDHGSASAPFSPPDSTTGPTTGPTPLTPSGGDHPRHGAEPSEP